MKKAKDWKGGPMWPADDPPSRCARCNASFSTFTRKQYCRVCGEACCSSCASKRVPVVGYGYDKDQRACKVCDKVYIKFQKEVEFSYLVMKNMDVHPHPAPPAYNTLIVNMADVMTNFQLPQINRFNIQMLESRNVIFNSPSGVLGDSLLPQDSQANESLPVLPAEIARGYYQSPEHEVIIKTMKIYNWSSFNRALHEVYIFNYLMNGEQPRPRTKTELQTKRKSWDGKLLQKLHPHHKVDNNPADPEKEVVPEKESQAGASDDGPAGADVLDYYGVRTGDADRRRSVFIPINFPLKWLAEQSREQAQPQQEELAAENYLVTLLGYYVDSNEVGLVFESMRWGSLRNFMLQSKQLQLINSLEIVLAVAKGLNALHNQFGLLHGNICPENILLSDSWECRIGGLGNAMRPGTQAFLRRSSQGERFYIAPEVLQFQQLSFKSDIYSLGMLMVSLFTGEPPYSQTSFVWLRKITDLFELGRNIQQYKLVPDFNRKIDFGQFLCSCLDVDPERRPTIGEVLQRLEDLDIKDIESMKYTEVVLRPASPTPTATPTLTPASATPPTATTEPAPSTTPEPGAGESSPPPSPTTPPTTPTAPTPAPSEGSAGMASPKASRKKKKGKKGSKREKYKSLTKRNKGKRAGEVAEEGRADEKEATTTNNTDSEQEGGSGGEGVVSAQHAVDTPKEADVAVPEETPQPQPTLPATPETQPDAPPLQHPGEAKAEDGTAQQPPTPPTESGDVVQPEKTEAAVVGAGSGPAEGDVTSPAPVSDNEKPVDSTPPPQPQEPQQHPQQPSDGGEGKADVTTPVTGENAPAAKPAEGETQLAKGTEQPKPVDETPENSEGGKPEEALKADKEQEHVEDTEPEHKETKHKGKKGKNGKKGKKGRKTPSLKKGQKTEELEVDSSSDQGTPAPERKQKPKKKKKKKATSVPRTSGAVVHKEKEEHEEGRTETGGAASEEEQKEERQVHVWSANRASTVVGRERRFTIGGNVGRMLSPQRQQWGVDGGGTGGDDVPVSAELAAGGEGEGKGTDAASGDAGDIEKDKQEKEEEKEEHSDGHEEKTEASDKKETGDDVKEQEKVECESGETEGGKGQEAEAAPPSSGETPKEEGAETRQKETPVASAPEGEKEEEKEKEAGDGVQQDSEEKKQADRERDRQRRRELKAIIRAQREKERLREQQEGEGDDEEGKPSKQRRETFAFLEMVAEEIRSVEECFNINQEELDAVNLSGMK